MIPKVLPPLTGLSVLVTRPAPQSQALCAAIEQAGAEAIAFPTIEIQPLQAAVAAPCDLAVFVSVNAVAHGAHLLPQPLTTRIAAIGKATAAALAAAELPAHIVPESGFDSESLLADPRLNLGSGARILIVRGEGGREVLQHAFTVQGLCVETREVYRRVIPQAAPDAIAALEARWLDGGVDVVTLTSVETLQNLVHMLSDRGRASLRATTLVVASRRIAQAALDAQCQGDLIVAAGADDASTLGALELWQTRARVIDPQRLAMQRRTH